MSDTPKPPSHLSVASKAWWRQIVDEFYLEPHHYRQLQAACEAWDRCQQARRAVAKHGPTYLDRFDAPRARPEVAIERDSRLACLRAIRELGLVF